MQTMMRAVVVLAAFAACGQPEQVPDPSPCENGGQRCARVYLSRAYSGIVSPFDVPFDRAAFDDGGFFESGEIRAPADGTYGFDVRVGVGVTSGMVLAKGSVSLVTDGGEVHGAELSGTALDYLPLALRATFAITLRAGDRVGVRAYFGGDAIDPSVLGRWFLAGGEHQTTLSISD